MNTVSKEGYNYKNIHHYHTVCLLLESVIVYFDFHMIIMIFLTPFDGIHAEQKRLVKHIQYIVIYLNLGVIILLKYMLDWKTIYNNARKDVGKS